MVRMPLMSSSTRKTLHSQHYTVYIEVHTHQLKPSCGFSGSETICDMAAPRCVDATGGHHYRAESACIVAVAGEGLSRGLPFHSPPASVVNAGVDVVVGCPEDAASARLSG
jgi:hypothetical protein